MHKAFRMLLLFTLLLVGNTYLSAIAAETENLSEIHNVQQFWQTFQDTPEKAGQTFLGKTIAIEGIVADTGISIYLTPNVRLSDKSGGEVYVICVLPRSDTDKLSSYRKNEHVTMTGRVYRSKEGGNVVIKECQRMKDKATSSQIPPAKQGA